MAAVRVVLPWSTWPMVPTLTCGFVRSNRFFAIAVLLLQNGRWSVIYNYIDKLAQALYCTRFHDPRQTSYQVSAISRRLIADSYFLVFATSSSARDGGNWA